MPVRKLISFVSVTAALWTSASANWPLDTILSWPRC